MPGSRIWSAGDMGKLKLLIRRGIRLANYAMAWLRDQLFASYCGDAGALALQRFGGSVRLPQLSAAESRQTGLMAEQIFAHHFDVLGSGWRDWGRPLALRVNRANRRRSLEIEAFLKGPYRPIDWHCDRRSGHRFSESRWARFIQPGPEQGVDIKVPWELSRMQHLLQLALLAVDAATDPPLARRCEREIYDQMHDFAAANPPRFGVNWRVAMDVAIRAANWVVVVALLDAGGRGTSPVRSMLGSSLRDHGRFIVTHLEWHPEVRGNHYLADVCGLAFIAAALPADDETNAWLALAVGEVMTEGVRQVNEDGSGFEGSTAYHRLSLDMLAYSIALLLGIDARRWRSLRDGVPMPRGLPTGFVATEIDLAGLLDADGRLQPPPALVERLWRAAGFTRAVTRADGRALLIGDNDSGRFIKPCPRYEVVDVQEARTRFPDRYVEPGAGNDWREIGEDHTHLACAIDALFGAKDDANVDARLIRWLAAGRTLRRPSASTEERTSHDVDISVAPAPPERCNSLEISFPRRIDTVQLALHAYPGWGLYLLKGDGLLLSFRCGPLGLSGTGNHDHNDQLGLTLHLDGRDWIADPGTYRYTADLAERDAYRSVQAHFAPRLRDGDTEPGSLTEGTWQLGDQARAVIEQVTKISLQGRHHGYGAAVHRRVQLFDDRVLIRDWSDDGSALMPLTEQYAELNRDGSALPFCPDYGVRRA